MRKKRVKKLEANSSVNRTHKKIINAKLQKDGLYAYDGITYTKEELLTECPITEECNILISTGNSYKIDVQIDTFVKEILEDFERSY